MAGTSLAFERPRSLVKAVGAVFGLAVMLLGLKMISNGAAGLNQFSWFETLIQVTNNTWLLGLSLGFLLTLITQSHMGIVLTALAMTRSGLFDFESAVFLICGAQLGSSAVTALTGLHFKGQPRQIILAQIIFNPLAVVSVGLIAWAGLLFDVNSAHLMSSWLSNGAVATDIAWFVLWFNLTGAVVMVILNRPCLRLCTCLSPVSDRENLSQLEFIRSELLEAPATGLLMGEKEQLRLLRRLPAYLDCLRPSPQNAIAIDPSEQHAAFLSVATGMHRFQQALAGRSLSTDETEQLLNQQNRQELVNSLEGTAYQMVQKFQGKLPGGETARFCSNIIEALDAQILTAIASLAEEDLFEAVQLKGMTADGGRTMEQIRKQFFAQADTLGEDDRGKILELTRLFERASWSLHRFALLRERSLTEPGKELRASAK